MSSIVAESGAFHLLQATRLMSLSFSLLMPHRVQPPGRIKRVCGATGGEGALVILSNSHTKNSCSGLAASADCHESGGGSSGGLMISHAPDP